MAKVKYCKMCDCVDDTSNFTYDLCNDCAKIVNPVVHKKKSYISKLRLAVIGFLGGKCKKCGFCDIRALQIDHVYGDGRKHRKTISPVVFYKQILKGEQTTEIQLLCANCNWIKRYTNREINRNFLIDDILEDV